MHGCCSEVRLYSLSSSVPIVHLAINCAVPSVPFIPVHLVLSVSLCAHVPFIPNLVPTVLRNGPQTMRIFGTTDSENIWNHRQWEYLEPQTVRIFGTTGSENIWNHRQWEYLNLHRQWEYLDPQTVRIFRTPQTVRIFGTPQTVRIFGSTDSENIWN